MSTSYTITVIGNPLAKNKKRARWVDGKPKVYPDQSHRPWSALVIDAVEQAGLAGKRFTGPLRVDCTWRFRRPRKHYRTGKHENELRSDAPFYVSNKPDRDNLDKAVLDALTQSGIWVDDAQASTGMLRREYVGPCDLPGMTIVIRPLERLAAAGGGGSDD